MVTRNDLFWKHICEISLALSEVALQMTLGGIGGIKALKLKCLHVCTVLIILLQ